MATVRRAVLLHAAVVCICIVHSLCDDIATQRDAVVALYSAVDAGGTLQTRFTANTTLCMLYGVICDEDGAIESLSLTGQQYQGTLPADLDLWGQLAESIKYLELSNIGLTGSIPQEMEVLGDSLLELRLNKNYLVGSIPSWSFLNLEVLDLSDNSLSGVVEPITTGVFPNLITFNLRDNPRLCGENATGTDVVKVNFSKTAYAPDCPSRLNTPQACDCLWASPDSYACSAAQANCTGSTERACAALDDSKEALTEACSPNQPPPPPPPRPPSLPPPVALSPHITLESSVSGGSNSNLVSNAANSSAASDVCDLCLGSFNNTDCKQAVCAYDATACGWLSAISTPNSANFTDSAEQFARWLKGDDVCASRLQYPANLCECKTNWNAADCRSAQLEACISRKDLCAQIISAPSSLSYTPIVNVYTNSCSVNQSAVISGVSVSLYLINRTLSQWADYRDEVRQALSDVGQVAIGNVSELAAMELPGPSAAKPTVLAVLHVASKTPEETFQTIYQAFQSQSMQPPKFTQALQTQNVPLTSTDLFAAMSLTSPPTPPKGGDGGKKKSKDVQWWLIVLICLAVIVLVGIILAVWFLYQRSRKKKDDIWDMKFPPPPSVHNSQYSPKPSRSVRLEPTGYNSRPGSLPPSAAPSPTMRSSNPYLDPERAFEPHTVPGPPIYAGSPYARSRYDTTPTGMASANQASMMNRPRGSNPHTPLAPPSPSMGPMNRDEAQAERAKFWAQFQLSWERQKARQAAGATNQRVGATFEDDEDIPSSGTSWTSQSDAKHAFRRY